MNRKLLVKLEWAVVIVLAGAMIMAVVIQLSPILRISIGLFGLFLALHAYKLDLDLFEEELKDGRCQP